MNGGNEVQAMILAAIGALYLLSLGGYGFTWKVWRWAVDQFNTLMHNHLAHLEARVKDLEDRAQQ